MKTSVVAILARSSAVFDANIQAVCGKYRIILFAPAVFVAHNFQL